MPTDPTGPSKPRRKSMPLDQIRPGPLRHKSLSPVQLERLRVISAALDGVDGMTFEERELNFLRDVNPDSELRVWEGIAAAYARFTASRSISRAAKQEAFSLLLRKSFGGTDQNTLANHQLKTLTWDEALELLQSYR